jgi:flavin reductase (DIM6/NTAB) family NADH-FMN oxidoreductase RutF
MRDLWKLATTTVGIVCTKNGIAINAMAAEWTYLVSKNPPHVAVVLSDAALTQQLASDGEFSVTLCAEEQAALADFLGSVSGRDMDKAASHSLVLREPTTNSTPWADGGVAAFECTVTQVVDLPGYRMVIGAIVAAHLPEEPRRPLVKHGGMYALGQPLDRKTVVTAAQIVDGAPLRIRIAATGAGEDPAAPFRISVVDPRNGTLHLGDALPDEYGDLLTELAVPDPPAWIEQSEVIVERAGASPGRSRLAMRRD